MPAPDQLESAEEYANYERSTNEAIAAAEVMIQAAQNGTLTPQQKEELPRLVGRLRQRLAVQMDWNGRIAQLDMDDGSYDNATTDNKLRIQLARLRNLDYEVNSMWGTRTIRKVFSWFGEDMPNWISIKFRQVADSVKQFLKVGGVAAAGVGGYYLGSSVYGVPGGIVGAAAGSLGAALYMGLGGRRRPIPRLAIP